MIDDETLTYLGPALFSMTTGGLLAQMCAFKGFGNLRSGVSVSTPAFYSLVKKTQKPPLTPQGDLRACKSPLHPRTHLCLFKSHCRHGSSGFSTRFKGRLSVSIHADAAERCFTEPARHPGPQHKFDSTQ